MVRKQETKASLRGGGPTACGRAPCSDPGAEAETSHGPCPAQHTPLRDLAPLRRQLGQGHFPLCAPSSCSCKTSDFHTQAELGMGSPPAPPLTSRPPPAGCSPRSLCLGPGPSAAPVIPYTLDPVPWLGLLAAAAAARPFPFRAWQRGVCSQAGAQGDGQGQGWKGGWRAGLSREKPLS